MVSAASSLSVDSSLLRTAYLEILVGGDSSGSIGDVCTVVKTFNITVQA